MTPTGTLEVEIDHLPLPHPLSVLEEWTLWARVERGLAPSTIRAYRRELSDLAHGGELHTLRPEDLRRWLHERGGRPATVARRLAAARSYYRWLVRIGRRKDDPTAGLDRPKVRRGLPRPVEDVPAVLERLASPWDWVVIFLAETGLRISEACAVDVAEVPDELLVLGKGGKERRVPLTADARTALRSLGGKMPASARTIQRHLHRVGITPHRLRHTLATQLAASGADIVDIQRLLGHASPATTTIYAEYTTGRLRKALERRDEC